jgi:hypothetical protein
MTELEYEEAIEQEIASLREENGEDEGTDEEEALGPEEVYRMAKEAINKRRRS